MTIPLSPEVLVPRLGEHLVQKGHITEEELQRILAIGGRIHDWAVLAAYAGLRRFEVLQVEADHLMMDERGPTLLVPNGKGGTRLSVPAHPLVVEVLQGRQPGRLWPIAITTFDKAWARAMQGAELQGCTFHRFRHRFATSVYRATGDLLTTAKVCRHRSINTTQVYARMVDERMRASSCRAAASTPGASACSEAWTSRS